MTRFLLLLLIALGTAIATLSSQALDIKKWEDEIAHKKPQAELKGENAASGTDKTESNKSPSNGDAPFRRFEQHQLFLGYAQLIFTFFLVVTTIVYAVVSYQQWHQLREANRLASVQAETFRQSVESDQRAWIFPLAEAPDDVFVPKPFPAGRPFTVRIGVKNVGKSPAQRVTSHHRWIVAPIIFARGGSEKVVDLEAMLPKGPDWVPVMMIAPQQTAALDFTNVTIPQDMLDDIFAKGSHALYFFARITYSDQFKNDRVSQFCLYWLPSMKPSHLEMCGVGNWAQ